MMGTDHLVRPCALYMRGEIESNQTRPSTKATHKNTLTALMQRLRDASTRYRRPGQLPQRSALILEGMNHDRTVRRAPRTAFFFVRPCAKKPVDS